MNIAWVFGNYVVTPQMALMLLPFYVLIPTISLPVIYLAEIMNALIIVLWFTPALNFGNPLSPMSPVQWFAAGRQLIWLGMFIQILHPIQAGQLLRGLMRRLGEPLSGSGPTKVTLDVSKDSSLAKYRRRTGRFRLQST
jgi:hypothetical protein